jgi:hypothetical protein
MDFIPGWMYDCMESKDVREKIPPVHQWILWYGSVTCVPVTGGRCKFGSQPRSQTVDGILRIPNGFLTGASIEQNRTRQKYPV